jgi:electron transfer flavoprotein beta subunit
MNIVVPVKFVPDLVEELEINEAGDALDMAYVRLMLNEFDDHAIEQAILLKESGLGGPVTVVALDLEEVDRVLFAAVAKGADRVIKLTGDFEDLWCNYGLSRVFANAIHTLRPELILTGVQAHNDLDGAMGPQLAEHLGMPYVGYVSGMTVSGGKIMVRKEYPGGLLAEMEVTLPAVLGIQAAEKPPRYTSVSKVMRTMKEVAIEEQPAAEMEVICESTVTRMFLPEVGERAAMLEGDEEEVAARLVEIFKERGLL